MIKMRSLPAHIWKVTLEARPPALQSAAALLPKFFMIKCDNFVMAKWGTKVTTAQPKQQRPVRSGRWGTNVKPIRPTKKR
jgi:hypothetical protein